jgi:hypothetical protein
VLKKGEIVFPGARRVLALLKEKSIPFVLCTNGGGIPEHVRCEKLTRELETEVRTAICSLLSQGEEKTRRAREADSESRPSPPMDLMAPRSCPPSSSSPTLHSAIW